MKHKKSIINKIIEKHSDPYIIKSIRKNKIRINVPEKIYFSGKSVYIDITFCENKYKITDNGFGYLELKEYNRKKFYNTMAKYVANKNDIFYNDKTYEIYNLIGLDQLGNIQNLVSNTALSSVFAANLAKEMMIRNS